MSSRFTSDGSLKSDGEGGGLQLIAATGAASGSSKSDGEEGERLQLSIAATGVAGRGFSHVGSTVSSTLIGETGGL